jgi:serine/threonine-protein kinase
MTPQQPPRAPFETGTTIGGKYKLVSLIGVGGVGRVYLAKHIELDTDVAIKVLRPEMMDRPDVVHRFSREARASVRLRSERVARVHDVGSHDGTPYFVMEYMVGCDLLELRQDDSIDIATLCEFFIQACEGLADAHAQGVVHRDIKPDNLFVVRESNGWRSLKIFDFGISKFSLTGTHSDVDLASNLTESMMGTPHYISPEQIRSTRDVDHRTDIWSLGAVMFEVLSKGTTPFREDREFTALIAEVLERPHRSLLDIAPNVPEGLAEIVDRCLTKDRDQRYQTAAEVALALLPFAPARARASAERAVAAMQASGLMAINADPEAARTSHPPAPGAARTSNPPPVVISPTATNPPPLSSLHTTAPSLRANRSAAAAAAAAAEAVDEFPQLRSRRPLVFGLLGLGAVAGLAFFFLNGAPSPEQVPASAPIQSPAPEPRIDPPAPLAAAAATPPAPEPAAPSANAAPSTVSPPAAKAAPAPRAPATAANRPAAAAHPVYVAPKPSAAAKPAPSPSPVTKPDLRRER